MNQDLNLNYWLIIKSKTYVQSSTKHLKETHIIKCNEFVLTFTNPSADDFESTLTDNVEPNFGEVLEVGFESTSIDNNDTILSTLARDYIANTEENILSTSNSKNNSSFRFRQRKRRTLFKIDNILQGIELQQK